VPRNRALWELARDLGQQLGLELEEAAVGGASDGNTVSQYTATLDGLGAVGGGAHAPHEHVRIDALVERCALLVLLLLAPLSADPRPQAPRLQAQPASEPLAATQSAGPPERMP
jgi:glutamate carboxypeptidase